MFALKRGRTLLKGSLSVFALISCASVSAVPIYWTDWQTSNGANGFTAQGAITTATSTVGVTYNNPRGVGFFQTGSPGETDYWQNFQSGRNPATSAYTGPQVDNIPTGTDIIALQWAGMQTLTFTETIAHPVFSYVSLNGNGYAFNQDFDILSFGDNSPGNDQGYWGAGTSYKQIVDLGGGNFEYRLLGTGEPHGTIRFTGAFDSVSWRSLTDEYWNGFTVGVEGTAQEVLHVPDGGSIFGPASLALAGLFGWHRRQLKRA